MRRRLARNFHRRAGVLSIRCKTSGTFPQACTAFAREFLSCEALRRSFHNSKIIHTPAARDFLDVFAAPPQNQYPQTQLAQADFFPKARAG
jgi:hypothetical protein